MDKILAAQPLKTPVLFVHALWDQEDIYGAIQAYGALEPFDAGNDRNFLVIGPWQHAGVNDGKGSLGPFRFPDSSALSFFRTVIVPFLNERLREGAPKSDTSPVLAYETGNNAWRKLHAWPLSCASGCPNKMQPLFLRAGMRLSQDPPDGAGAEYAEYVSDPAQPVPYRERPIQPVFSRDSTWGLWLLDDQRYLASRPDVLTYISDVLKEPLALNGQPIANLFASTSGTDSDFVAKLIDVYPEEYPLQPELAGYQLMISADILRGRYRKDAARPLPVPAGKIELYRWPLPATTHVFLPGHRIMVQIQSSWFPLYDRNPQTYVENIFKAKPGDYRKAVQRIYQAGDHASFLELPVVP